MDTTRSNARTAGVLYLLLVLVAPLRLVYIPNTLFVGGDVAATVANITANPALFQLGMLADLFCGTLEVFLDSLGALHWRSKADRIDAKRSGVRLREIAVRASDPEQALEGEPEDRPRSAAVDDGHRPGLPRLADPPPAGSGDRQRRVPERDPDPDGGLTGGKDRHGRAHRLRRPGRKPSRRSPFAAAADERQKKRDDGQKKTPRPGDRTAIQDHCRSRERLTRTPNFPSATSSTSIFMLKPRRSNCVEAWKRA